MPDLRRHVDLDEGGDYDVRPGHGTVNGYRRHVEVTITPPCWQCRRAHDQADGTNHDERDA